MIAELQQAVANYAHALDELNAPELEAVLTEGPGQRRGHGDGRRHRRGAGLFAADKEHGESIQMISTGVYMFGLCRSDGEWRIAELTLALDNAV